MQSISRSTRRHRTSSEKAELVAAYRRSGLSQRDFALGHGVAPSNIQRWARQAQDEGRPVQAALVEVPNVLSAVGGGAVYRLRFPKGVTLEVSRGFAAREVSTLVQLLQSL